MAYSDYDTFAFFYNRYWTKATPKLMEEALEPLLFAELPEGGEVLDLCCGTGNNANMIAEKGYKVTGVDGSEDMLAYARVNAPNLEFIMSDVRELDLGKQFDGITCLFDSINHLLEPDQVIQVFTKVYNHLKEGGVFVFDVNAESAAEEVSDGDFSAVTENDVFISSAVYNKKSRIITYSLTMFIKDEGEWQRKDLTIKEKYYTVSELMDMLRKGGFSSIRVSDGFDDLDIESFEGRIFITCWK